MIWTYILIVLLSVIVAVSLARRGSRHAVTDCAPAVIGLLAIVTGFSIGFILAPVALVLLVFAAAHLQLGDRR